jgi:hypothetical protein
MSTLIINGAEDYSMVILDKKGENTPGSKLIKPDMAQSYKILKN